MNNSPVIPILPECPPKPKLLDQVRRLIRAKHYSLRTRTERAYLFWIRRYILFHGKRHPASIAFPKAAGRDRQFRVGLSRRHAAQAV